MLQIDNWKHRRRCVMVILKSENDPVIRVQPRRIKLRHHYRGISGAITSLIQGTSTL